MPIDDSDLPICSGSMQIGSPEARGAQTKQIYHGAVCAAKPYLEGVYVAELARLAPKRESSRRATASTRPVPVSHATVLTCHVIVKISIEGLRLAS